MDVDLDHLSEKLTELPDGAMEGALCIIESDQPEAVSDSGEGGVEIDLTCLSHGTIRQLLAYVSRNVTTSATIPFLLGRLAQIPHLATAIETNPST